MKVVAFGASNSHVSINKSLALYAASKIVGASVDVLDLNDFELPIFSSQREAEMGQPDLAKAFFEKLGSANVIIVSFAEHNGNYSAAYKNLFDWCSRIDKQVYQGKPTLVMSAAPGPRGGKSVLDLALSQLERFGADIRGSFSLPHFRDNFDQKKGVMTNVERDGELDDAVAKLV